MSQTDLFDPPSAAVEAYRRKLEEKRRRLETRAARARAESERASDAAHRMLSCIPPGQPILVGHHSEKRHRRDLDRIDRNMRKAIDERDKAEHYERRAAAVGKAGISSEDPGAVQKLRQKIARLQRERESYKRVNTAWRKAGKPKPNEKERWVKIAESLGLGLEAMQHVRLSMANDPLGRSPYPPYALTNIGSRIRQAQDRIHTLEREAEAVAKEEETATGIKLEECPEENRLRIWFPSKPSRAVLAELRSAGFRWAPSIGCHQRQLTDNARCAASWVVPKIERIRQEEAAE